MILTPRAPILQTTLQHIVGKVSMLTVGDGNNLNYRTFRIFRGTNESRYPNVRDISPVVIERAFCRPDLEELVGFIALSAIWRGAVRGAMSVGHVIWRLKGCVKGCSMCLYFGLGAYM